MVHVKICCIASYEEARLAIDHGAHALGLVARMPSGPGPISDGTIASIAAAVPSPTRTYLLTSETRAEEIVAHHRRTRTTTVQLVDELEDARYNDLRTHLPGVELVQVIHVRDERSIDQALAAAELGGTGRTHDWSISRGIVQRSRVPVFLAGGLHAGNVAWAIAQVRPHGVDVCSGVRTGGALDPGKLQAFFAAVRGA